MDWDDTDVDDDVDLTELNAHIADVDERHLAQVLTNLLSNALRHTPAGGTVSLAARRDGPEVVLTVRDDGEGIPAAQLPHVFERFYRGDSARDRDRSGWSSRTRTPHSIPG